VIDRMHIVNCGVMFNNKKKHVWKSLFPPSKKTSKSHITPEKLVATGSIVPELYYGPYLRDWRSFFKAKT